jgi:osmotically-inducible protein OsmY
MAVAVLLSPPRIGTDERLAQNVASAVRTAGVRYVPGLRIVASQGRVTLHGLARTFYEKQLVIHAAQRVPGVERVIDEMDVLPQIPE